MVIDLSQRHPSTQQLMRFFTYDHLPRPLQQLSAPVCELAALMVESLPDGPELTTGLRKLLEAKDCFVRAALPEAPPAAAPASAPRPKPVPPASRPGPTPARRKQARR